MRGKDVWARIQALRQRRYNLTFRDLEEVAKDAGWRFDRNHGNHAIYTKQGFLGNLSIPRRNLKGKTALRILAFIESSLPLEEGEERISGEENR